MGSVYPQDRPREQGGSGLRQDLFDAHVSIAIYDLRFWGMDPQDRVNVNGTVRVKRAHRPILVGPFRFVRVLYLFKRRRVIQHRRRHRRVLLVDRSGFFYFVRDFLRSSASYVLLTRLRIFVRRLRANGRGLKRHAIVLCITQLRTVRPVRSSRCGLTHVRSFRKALIRIAALRPILIVVNVTARRKLLHLTIGKRRRICRFSSNTSPCAFIFVFHGAWCR